VATRYHLGWRGGEEVTVIGFDHGYVRVVGDGKELSIDTRRKRIPVSDPIQKAVRKSRKKTEDFPERRRTVRLTVLSHINNPSSATRPAGRLRLQQ